MSRPINTPSPDTSATDSRVILFYDGVCVLCNRSVRWVIRHDRADRFRFASLDSLAARELLPADLVTAGTAATVILLDGAEILMKSDAWLRTVSRLGPSWSWLTVLRLIPRPLRDWFYDRIAARRYQWFGKLGRCPLPDPKDRHRFLA